MNYYVYKHTCPNGKIYIGITQQEPKKRWQRGLGYYKNKHFINAIKKYGWDNIKHEILYEHLSEKVAREKEIELIKKYKSNQREYGYNKSTGGEKAAQGVRRTIEMKEKQRQKMLGRHLTKEQKEKISNSLKGIKKQPFTRVHLNNLKGSHGKAVQQFTKDGSLIKEFSSLINASKETNVDNRHICHCCKGHRKTAGGYIWRYKNNN